MSVDITAVIMDNLIAYHISSERKLAISASGDEKRIRPKKTAIRMITVMSVIPMHTA
ncbi:hypothetical protein [Methanocorpusculum sp.]|jgi:hypothetical protein|uniref:hypothetical protein n=1 Tax=Methanocorpusculum sp. TaxID=2058474 RepID=UPI00272CDA9E|nr:hypothetical protein [Methanocorpusculum sp.]